MDKIVTLKITDGVDSVDLLNDLRLNDWRVSVTTGKQGGTYQSSSLSDFRRLVDRKFSTAFESLDIKIPGGSQPTITRKLNRLIVLLEQAVSSETADWSNDVVWLEVKLGCVDTPIYGQIINYTIPQLNNPFAQPFATNSHMAVLDDITLVLERTHWSLSPPQTGLCLPLTISQQWGYETNWTNVNPSSNSLNTGLAASNGFVYHGKGNPADVAGIDRSIDNGNTWVNQLALAGNTTVHRLFEISNGYLLAMTFFGSVRRTIDNGVDGWPEVLNVGVIVSGGGGFTEQPNGEILVALGNGQVHVSNDNGGTWNLRSSALGVNPAELTTTNRGTVISGNNDGEVFRSIDNGLTWTNVGITPGATPINSQIQLSNGQIWLGSNAGILVSTTDGLSWTNDPSLGDVWSFLEATDGFVYAGTGTGGTIFRSNDFGDVWVIEASVGTNRVYSIIENLTTDTLFATPFSDMYRREPKEFVQMGKERNCDNEVILINKSNQANLTNILIDDAGVFTEIFPMTSFPTDFMPTLPVVNDATYFGINTDVEVTGPFCNLVFDIQTPVTIAGTNFEIIWEYPSTGPVWNTLTVTDETAAVPTAPFSLVGLGVVSFIPPTNWIETPINGITGFWIRARVSVLAGVLTAPSQQNNNIYSANRGGIKIAAEDVRGEVPALTRTLFQNRSDFNGRGGTLELWANRVVVGLRSESRGVNFEAYVNLSVSTQALLGVSTGANTASAIVNAAPTGSLIRYTPVGVSAILPRAIVNIPETLSQDYFGSFRVFVRLHVSAGTPTDFELAISVQAGSGSANFVTESLIPQTNTFGELLDFGRVQMPVATRTIEGFVADVTQIEVGVGSSTGAGAIDLIDLILIPIDEWTMDSSDFSNVDNSIIGRIDINSRALDVDSISSDKVPIGSYLRLITPADDISSIYSTISPERAIVQANQDQTLWVLQAQTSATGNDFEWISRPEYATSVKGYKHERLLGLPKDDTISG